MRAIFDHKMRTHEDSFTRAVSWSGPGSWRAVSATGPRVPVASVKDSVHGPAPQLLFLHARLDLMINLIKVLQVEL